MKVKKIRENLLQILLNTGACCLKASVLLNIADYFQTDSVPGYCQGRHRGEAGSNLTGMKKDANTKVQKTAP